MNPSLTVGTRRDPLGISAWRNIAHRIVFSSQAPVHSVLVQKSVTTITNLVGRLSLWMLWENSRTTQEGDRKKMASSLLNAELRVPGSSPIPPADDPSALHPTRGKAGGHASHNSPYRHLPCASANDIHPQYSAPPAPPAAPNQQSTSVPPPRASSNLRTPPASEYIPDQTPAGYTPGRIFPHARCYCLRLLLAAVWLRTP